MTLVREHPPGFYWVRSADGTYDFGVGPDWTVAEFTGSEWNYVGDEQVWSGEGWEIGPCLGPGLDAVKPRQLAVRAMSYLIIGSAGALIGAVLVNGLVAILTVGALTACGYAFGQWEGSAPAERADGSVPW